jgi:sensor histidine kinase regulating citrate/malate metabolism
MRERLEINKTAFTVIGLNVLQIAAIIGIIIYSSLIAHESILSSRFTSIHVLLVLVTFTVFVNSLTAMRNRHDLIRSGIQYDLLKDTLAQVEDLNRTLRAQRHDFMNHLQVVYSLMEMEEYKDARDYIDRVYNDIQRVGKALKTSIPAVNALLQAKLLTCEKREISANLNASTQLSGLKIPSWEFCRVLGNLIDNAIHTLEEKNDDRHLTIELFEDIKSYSFRISNNGAMIPANLLERIFEAGFTTRADRGQGMGLTIARETLAAYGGSICVKSSESVTVFEGSIPK